MASFIINNKVIVSVMFMCVTLSLMVKSGNSTEFTVGESKGWGVPPPKQPNTYYNQWAEKKRFKVNDTLEFQYKKDSVMIVSEEEYEKCKSQAPIYFSNNGNTAITLDRSGLFYFISGVTGHCELGQKMVVKVLDVTDTTTTSPPPPPPPPSSPAEAGDNNNGDDGNNKKKKKKNGAVSVARFESMDVLSMVLVGVFGVLV
ncbi:hypothetical protein vseg_013756 [Gypsophila vaccaria]